MAVHVPTDILFAASQIIDDILDPAWAEDDDEAANYVALAIVAERNRSVDQVCFPADWHTREDQSVAALLDDIRDRIRGEA